MKASVPAQCPQVPGLQPVLAELPDSVLREHLPQRPDSVPRELPVQRPASVPADNVLQAEDYR